MGTPAVVRVIRSGLPESEHVVDVVVARPDGRIMASAGDPGRRLYARSSMKPLQATVSVEHSKDAFTFSHRQVAVMCASHNAEPVHVATVRTMLQMIGLDEHALRCPPRRPMDAEAAAGVSEPLRIHSDCSGKHTGMLAACVARGWPIESYLEPDHPYQQAVEAAVRQASGAEDLHVGVDGCGAPVHELSLQQMAMLYARIVSPEMLPDLEWSARRAVAAMRDQPYMVAGRNRVDTALMKAAPRFVAKGGAEGLLSAAAIEDRIGIAVRSRDGASRPTGPVLIEVLRQLDLVKPDQVEALQPYAHPPVLGGGQPVGELVTELALSS